MAAKEIQPCESRAKKGPMGLAVTNRALNREKVAFARGGLSLPGLRQRGSKIHGDSCLSLIFVKLSWPWGCGAPRPTGSDMSSLRSGDKAGGVPFSAEAQDF